MLSSVGPVRLRRLLTARRRARRLGWVATGLLAAAPAGAQSGVGGSRADGAQGSRAEGAQIDAVVDTGRVTVGDQIAVHVRVRLPQDARPVDSVPRTTAPIPDAVRVLAIERLHRVSGGEWAGAVRIAVFRPGEIQLPAIAVAYRGASTTEVDTLTAPPPALIVSALVPGGVGSLRDIKDIERAAISVRAATGAAAAILVAAVLVVLGITVRQRRAARGARGGVTEPAEMPSPYAAALARLAAIANTDWAAHGEVAAPFVLAVDVLRRYLDEAHGVPALVQTTPEVLAALPPRLLQPALRTSACALLDRADLIKFARLNPRPPAAADFVAGARSLLADWEGAKGHIGVAGAAHDSGSERLVTATTGVPNAVR